MISARKVQVPSEKVIEALAAFNSPTSRIEHGLLQPNNSDSKWHRRCALENRRASAPQLV